MLPPRLRCSSTVLSIRVTCLFDFHCSGVDDMVGGLKGINHKKWKYDTSLNICKGHPSLEEARKTDVVISAESDNFDSECNNEIVTETNDSDYGSLKPSSPSGTWGLMRILFIFGVEYIYWWCGLWLSLMSIMIIFTQIIIFGVNCDYFWCKLWQSLSFFLFMRCIFYLLILQGMIPKIENQQF